MADAIKSLLLEIDTQFKAKGIDDAKKGIGGLSRSTEDFVKRINDNINKIGTTLDKVGNKKIGIKGVDAEIRDLVFLKKALQDIAAQIEEQPDLYSQEQIEAGQKLITLTEEYTKKLNEQADAAKSADNTEAFLESVSALTPALGQYAYAADRAIAITREYISASKVGAESSTTLGKALTFLSGTYGKIAAAIGAIVGTIVAATKYSGELEDTFSKIGTKLEIYAASAVRGFGLIGEGIAKLTSGQFIEGLKKIGEGLSPTPNIYALEVYANLIEELQDKTVELEVANSRLNASYAEQLEIISDEKKTLDDAQRSREAVIKARQIALDIQKNESFVAKENLRVFELRNKLLNIDPNNLTDKLKAERAKLQLAVDDAERRYSNTERQLNKREKELNAFEESLKKQIKDSSNELFKTADDIDFQAKIGELYAVPAKLTEVERLKLIREAEKAKEELKMKFEELKKEFEANADRLPEDIKTAYRKALGAYEQSIADLQKSINKLGRIIVEVDFLPKTNNTIDRQLTEAEKKYVQTLTDKLPAIALQIETDPNLKINELSDDKKKALLKDFIKRNISDKLTPEQIDLLVKQFFPELNVKPPDITKNKPDQDEKNKLIAAKKAAIEERRQKADQLFGELNDLIEIEKAKTDALVTEQERRVEKAKEMAAYGNAEQLQLEEERLNKLLNQQREYARQQREIQAVQKAADTAFAIAEFVAGAATAFAKNPFAAILEIGALVASVFAGISALRSASQGFEAGSDYVTDGSRTFSKRGPTDTIPAWLAPGEMVVPKGIADKIRSSGYGVHDLPSLIPGDSASRMMSMIRDDNKTSVYVQTSKMEKLLEENNRLIRENTESIQGQLVRIEYDESGHIIKQRRLMRQEEKRRNGRR